MITAKVYCDNKVERGEGDDRSATVTFRADYDDGRNREWSYYTPGLSLQMTLNGDASDLFAPGTSYTLQFVEGD